MALDARHKQRKAEKRKAKERAKRKELAHRKTENLGQRLERASKAPVLHCQMSETLFREGMGSVVFSRELISGQVAYAVFLIDSYCLGVKNIFFGFRPKSEYFEDVYERLAEQYEFEALSPAAARKLVEGAVEYARKLGLSPHPDYANARHIFGDIDATASARQFEFGKRGKPYFISGPRDTPGRIASVMGILTERLGTGGFEYLVAIDESRLSEFVLAGDVGAPGEYLSDEDEDEDEVEVEGNQADEDVIEGVVVSPVAALSQAAPSPERPAGGES